MDNSNNTVARSLHDLGAAAWFGGSLMGAVGVNKGAARTADDSSTADVAGAGWSAWTPVNLVAIGAHLAGGAMILGANRKRVVAQSGVATVSTVKTALTAVALAATGYSRVIGQRVISSQGTPASDGTTPTSGTDPKVASAQRQLAALQWVIPLTTGAIIVCSAVMGEQQRPQHVVAGVVERVAERLHVA